jgi:hypothetical protein
MSCCFIHNTTNKITIYALLIIIYTLHYVIILQNYFNDPLNLDVILGGHNLL